jgi:hypothetical protein
MDWGLGVMVEGCASVRPEASWARTSPPRDDVGARALAPLLYIGLMSLGKYIIGTECEHDLLAHFSTPPAPTSKLLFPVPDP